MQVRVISSFYVSHSLICRGQTLDIDPAIAALYVARGDTEYTLPEQAVLPRYETATTTHRPRKRK